MVQKSLKTPLGNVKMAPKLYILKNMVYLASPRFLMNSFKLLKVENLASTSCATAAAPEVLFCVAQYDEQKFLGRTN